MGNLIIIALSGIVAIFVIRYIAQVREEWKYAKICKAILAVAMFVGDRWFEEYVVVASRIKDHALQRGMYDLPSTNFLSLVAAFNNMVGDSRPHIKTKGRAVSAIAEQLLNELELLGRPCSATA